jgi:hypothetical protein
VNADIVQLMVARFSALALELCQDLYVQGLGASDCKTELSRRSILADSGTDQTVQRTLVAE